MPMFTLAISCLTTSNLPWFMDLTFQVPIQYCSLQHWALLPLPVTSTYGCCFHFGSICSFFLELGVYWAPTDLGSSFFSVLFAFSCCSRGSQGKNIEMVCHSLSSGPCFLRTLHHDPFVLRGPTGMAPHFIELDKAGIHGTLLSAP